jgi:hypothetical protein
MFIGADLVDIAGSPIWATILAAVAILVSLYLYRRQRTRKSLSYEIKLVELVSVHRAAEGRIKVLFDEEEIGQVHLVEARFENNGNVPVTAEDFEQAISLDLGDGATALTADVTDVTPEDLHVEARPRGNRVEIQPLLLNPGDCMTLKAFARDLRGEVECRYRIVGVARMDDAAAQRQNRQSSLHRWSRASGAAVSALAGLVTFGVVTLSLSGIVGWVAGPEKSDSTVTTWGEERLCGEVLATSDRRIVVQVGDGGAIRAIPIGDVKSIDDNSC